MWRVQQMFTFNSMIIQSKMYVYARYACSSKSQFFCLKFHPSAAAAAEFLIVRQGITNQLNWSVLKSFSNLGRSGKRQMIHLNLLATDFVLKPKSVEMSQEWLRGVIWENVIEHLELLRWRNVCNSSELPNDR